MAGAIDPYVLITFGMAGHTEISGQRYRACKCNVWIMFGMTACAEPCVDLVPEFGHARAFELLDRVAVIREVQFFLVAGHTGLVQILAHRRDIFKIIRDVAGLTGNFELMVYACGLSGQHHRSITRNIQSRGCVYRAGNR